MPARRNVCRRKGCEQRVQSWQHLCASCWAEIPGEDRAAIVKLGHEKRYGARDERRNAAVRQLGRKQSGPPVPTPEASAEAFARSSALLGERDGEIA